MDHGMNLRGAPGREGRKERPSGKPERLEAIRRVIRSHAVGTQEELGRLLEAEGFRVTQATLSRDLARLRAVRLARPDGGAVYGLEAEGGPREGPNELAELVLAISDNEALSVLRTVTGAAPAVARAIDVARLPECLGTLAGDDTIFVTPVRGTSSRKLTAALRALFAR